MPLTEADVERIAERVLMESFLELYGLHTTSAARSLWLEAHHLLMEVRRLQQADPPPPPANHGEDNMKDAIAINVTIDHKKFPTYRQGELVELAFLQMAPELRKAINEQPDPLPTTILIRIDRTEDQTVFMGLVTPDEGSKE